MKCLLYFWHHAKFNKCIISLDFYHNSMKLVYFYPCLTDEETGLGRLRKLPNIPRPLIGRTIFNSRAVELLNYTTSYTLPLNEERDKK